MNAIKFFGCRYTPFADTFEVKEPFLTTSDERTLERMANLLNQGKSMALSGEPGVGKSMLLKSLASRLDTKVFKPVLVPFGGLKRNQILKEICDQMDIDTSGRAALLTRLREACKRTQDTPFPVIIIDDAHEMEKQSFLDVCSILHDPHTRTAAASVIFCGHPQLKKQLELNVYKSIRTRLAFFFEMKPLSHEETADFISFRLAISEAPKNMFQKNAVALIAMDTAGNRRMVMMHAGNYMDEAVQRKEKVVTADLIHTVQNKMNGGR
jgi:type II secretory pathway predicted ATPase ExeA